MGGAWPWVMWSATALFFCYGFFSRVAPSVMVEDLMRDFAAGAAVVGNLSAFYFYAYAGLQVPVGIGLDRFGPRRMITFAAGVCGLGSVLFGLADSIAAAYAGRFLIGAGAAFAMIGTLKLASLWFSPRRYALVFGLTVALGCAGAVGGQGPLAALVEMTGWREAQIGGGILSVALAALIWAVVRDRPAGRAATARRPRVWHGLAVVLGNRQSWYLAALNAAMVSPLFGFGALWGVPYMMTAYDLSRPAAGFAASMMLVGHGVAAPVIGWYSDRIGRRKPITIAGAVVAAAAFAVAIYVPAQPWWSACVFLFLYGAASGSSAVAYTAAKEHNPIGFTGVASGFVNMATMGTSAVMQALLGWILDLNWDGAMNAGARVYSLAAYQTAMAFLVASGLLAVAAALLTRETYCQGRE